MDLDYSFGEKVTVTPRDFPLRCSQAADRHFGYIGMATIMEDYPLYAEAMNEKGLCIAGLNFPRKAFYRAPMAGKINVPAYDFNSYIAAKYSSVQELRQSFSDINITNEPFSDTVPCAPLHWMIADGEFSVVIESTEAGISLYDDPLDVMTNLPEFSEHLENYKNMTEKGSVPADFPVLLSSPSRFLRIAHFRGNNLPISSCDTVISHVFHILDTVAMPDASAKAESGNYHKTTYSACLDTVNRSYLFRTYENSRISCVKMKDELLERKEISTFEISRKQDYSVLN